MDDNYGKSSFGFEENIVAAASYFLVGPVIYVKEQYSHYVRFHALQATLGYAFLMVFWLAVQLIPILAFLSMIPGLLALIFVVFMMKKAYDGVEYKLPIIGKIAYESVFETSEDLLADVETETATKVEPEKKTQDTNSKEDKQV